MREIKFKVWHKRKKEMFQLLKLHYHKDGWNLDRCDDISMVYCHKSKPFDKQEELLFGRKEVELLQYTGLKDDTGKNIYEGDIIKQTFLEKDKDGKEYTFNHKIEYLESLAVWAPIAAWEMFPDQRKEYITEVIGNIYENPDIMKSAIK